MRQFQQTLLEVWREACRHTDLANSSGLIAELVAKRIPIDHLGVLTFDPERGRLHPRASALGEAGRIPGADRDLRPEEAARLLAWAGSGHLLRLPSTEPDAAGLAALLLPGPPGARWLLAMLGTDEHPAGGILLLRLREDADCSAEHEAMVLALVEPLSAALDNDRRFHELASLREAAEADKRSALARLGREDLRDVVVGAEAGLAPVMERVGLVARLDVPVLLLGETGTGKEVIARTIHEASSRSRGPFLRVNCGAIPPELIDSELFGHEKGAFTGATSSRRGWFERADNGTLLLDEVGELPPPAQVRLLRVLQEGSFERVGGERNVSVDVRIVASTHRDLPAMVQNGEFRQDLWYRIAGFPIVIPPLRERRRDIAALAEHFLERAARRFGLRPCRLSPDDVARLVAYDWPGNVRELISVIDRAAILGDGSRLEVAAALGGVLPDGRGARTVQSEPGRGAASVRPQQETTRDGAALQDAMKRHIEDALRDCRGRIEGRGGAAERLDVNPHTLRARMRKLGIDWQRFRS